MSAGGLRGARLARIGAPKASIPSPPAHLSRRSRALWRSIVSEYALEAQHLAVLRLFAEALDRAEAAREILAVEGLTIAGARGGSRVHPLASVRRDAEVSAARLLRELSLEDPPSETRPPRGR